MIPVGAGHFLALSGLLFAIGMGGVLLRRNALVVFMSVELMLNAGNLALATFSRFYWNLSGQVVAFMVMVVAACEVAVGLAIILSIFRVKDTVDLSEMRTLKW